jgi:hypothetical protein
LKTSFLAFLLFFSISQQTLSQTQITNPTDEYSFSTSVGTSGSYSNFAVPYYRLSTLLVGSNIVNAPAGFDVDLSKCQAGSTTCSYRVNWCFDQPGTYFASVIFDLFSLDFSGVAVAQVTAPTTYTIQVTSAGGPSQLRCPGGPSQMPTPTPAPTPIPTPSPTPILDLAVGQISVSPSNQEADLKPSVSPGSVLNINVPVTGSNILPNDSRTTIVTLQYGSKTLTQNISLSSLASGAAYNVPFSVTFQPEDAGDQTLISEVNSSNSLGETNLANNVSSQLIHVLCKVADKNNGKPVPWFYQSQAPWGSQDYANQAPKKMSKLGCMVTSLAMLFKHYGIDTAADGSAMTPGSVNSGLNATPLYGELGPKYSSYKGFTSTGAVQPNGAVAFARNSYILKCIRNGGDAETCTTASKSQISYKFSINSFTSNSQKIINKEICLGNPVILKVSSISAPSDKSKAHFIIATGMGVDANGQATYITNNPASANGENEIRSANADKIKGYRLYRPTYDPSMVFMHLAGNADMIITDPQGRKTGFNPITQQSYSEIPEGTYFTAESISDPSDPNIFTPPESRFEGMNPVSGQYQVQVFAKSNTSYQLTSYSFDSTGTINGISDKMNSLKAGTSEQVLIQHAADALPIKSASLEIRKADFFDLSHRDMAFISGVIKPSDGHAISSIEKYIQVKVGPFAKSIEVKQLIKHKHRGHTMYTFGSFGKKGMLIELDADTGEFKLFIGNVDLDNGDTSIIADVTIQVDDIIAKNLVTFKEIRKKKINGN